MILSKGSLTLPPENHSAGYIDTLKTRIIRFARKHDRLPGNLEDLLPLEDFINRTKDAWGNPFIMIADNYSVTLISYGQDKKLGGTGNNKDVIGIFLIKTEDGRWVEEDDDNWIKKPLGQYGE